MIVVRNVFRLKYGEMRPVLALFKEGKALMVSLGFAKTPRVTTDLVGPAYTIVLENTFETLSEFEQEGRTLFSNDKWHAWYAKLTPHVESGYREIFTIVE